MKNRKYTILLFALTLIGIFVYGSCTKGGSDCKQTTTTYNISSSDKSKIPYTGKDTLTFVRTNTNDTFTFYGTGWQSGFNTSYITGDCSEKQNRESRILIFQSPTFSKQLTINQFISSNSEYASDISFNFQNVIFSISSGSVCNPFEFDSLKIGNKFYYQVSSFSNTNLIPTPTDHKLYYNISNAILKMVLPSGELWELVPKN